MIVKTCYDHGDLTEADTYKNQKGSLMCRLCVKAHSHKYYLANKQKVNQKARKRHEKLRDQEDYIERRRIAVSKFYQATKNDEARKARYYATRNEHKKIAIKKLEDSYIKSRLYAHLGFTVDMINQIPALIDLKRAQIAIMRAKSDRNN